MGPSVERHRRHIFTDGLRTLVVVSLIPAILPGMVLEMIVNIRECQKICQD